MTTPNITALVASMRAAAEKATAGTWQAGTYSVVLDGGRGPAWPPDDKSIASLYDGEYIENANAQNDAAHIAFVGEPRALSLQDHRVANTCGYPSRAL